MPGVLPNRRAPVYVSAQQETDTRQRPMTFDAEYQRHRQDWIGFTQFVKYGTGAVIVVLIGMAIFLL